MRVKWILQDEAKSGDEGGGGTSAADARTYLTGFGHSEDSLKGMQDADVLKLHGVVSGSVKKATEDAVKTAGGKVEWPSDWRQRIAGDNPEALKTLERFAEPSAMYKSYDSMRQRMASGELKANVPFPEKGTDQEKSAWRKEHGIPEKPDGYDYSKLGDGVVIGEDDKPLVNDYLAFAHARHMPESEVKSALGWFFGPYREKVEQQRSEAEADAIKAAEDDLRNAWGPDYRANMNAIDGLLDANVSADSDMRARIKKSISLEPEFAKLWAGIARQINPVTTISGAAGDVQKSALDEWKSIGKTMRENRAAYNKDASMQSRFLELTTFLQKNGVLDANGNEVQRK